MSDSAALDPIPDAPSPARDRSGSRLSGRALDAILLLGSLGCYAVVQMWIRYAPRIYDPIEYFFIATRLDVAEPFHRSLRIGLLLPIRAVQWIFGYSEVAYYAVPMFFGLLLVGSVFILGRITAGRGVATVAALLVMANPLVLGESSQIYPDLPSAAAFTASMTAIIAAGKRFRRTSHVDANVYLLMAVAGFFLGWSYLIRELVVFLFPVVLVAVLLYRLPLRTWAALAAPALALLGVELAWGAIMHGDALVRFRDVITRPPPTGALAEATEARGLDQIPIGDKLLVFPRILGFGPIGIVWMALAVIGIVGTIVERRRAFMVLVGWSLLYWALLTSLYLWTDEYGRAHLRITLVRYWFPLLPPLVTAGVAATAALVRRFVTPRAVRAGVMAAGAVAALGIAWASILPLHQRASASLAPFQEFRGWLQELDESEMPDTIWSDQRSGWILDMYTKGPAGTPIWNGDVSPFNVARRFFELDMITPGVVVIHDDFFRTTLSGWRGAVPDYLIDPPPDWIPVKATRGAELVMYEQPAEAPASSIEVASGDSGWTEIRTQGSPEVTTQGGRISADLAANEALTFTDDEATDPGSPPAEPTSVPDAGVITVTTEIDVNRAWVEFLCVFFDGEESTRVEGSTLYHPASGSAEVEFVCDVPEAESGEVTMRPEIRANGPGSVALEGLRMEWYPAAEG